VQSGETWVLVDTAWRGRAELIRSAAETLFGVGARPRAIVLTHVHPDYAGSASELAHMWDVTVYVHPDELPLPPQHRRDPHRGRHGQQVDAGGDTRWPWTVPADQPQSKGACNAVVVEQPEVPRGVQRPRRRGRRRNEPPQELVVQTM